MKGEEREKKLQKRNRWSNDRKFAYVVIGGKELKNIRLASVSSLHDGQFYLTLSQSDNSNMPREIWLTSGKKKTQQVKVYKFKGEGPSTEYPLNYGLRDLVEYQHCLSLCPSPYLFLFLFRVLSCKYYCKYYFIKSSRVPCSKFLTCCR